ncbi:heat induced stress protein YflT [Neobacillus bataviensis]|uniref:Heat induced stress protein YflT n=1 Tax=Neobacillus bataviensis TaxID=220685 RepID=A0A561DXK5_9BACI|nr:general stress protein [Neobacillus bataviensis]TWE08093.1 heat induced stress protein YflT [Neobacillus bataviensis]
MYEHEKHLVGVYDTEQEVIQAVEDLKRQGYASEDISVIGKNKDAVKDINDTTGTTTEKSALTGAATGGALGGILGLLAGVGALAIPGIGPIVAAGPIAATLTGAAAGAGVGGLAGVLIGLGIPEEEADRYEGYVKEGKFLVVTERRQNRLGEGQRVETSVNQNDTDVTISSNDPYNTPVTSLNQTTNLHNNRGF